MAAGADAQIRNAYGYPVHPSTGYGIISTKAYVVTSFDPNISVCPDAVPTSFTHNPSGANNKYNTITISDGYLIQTAAMPTKNDVMASLVGPQGQQDGMRASKCKDRELALVYSTNTPLGHIKKLLQVEVEPLVWVDKSGDLLLERRRNPLEEYESRLGDAFFGTVEHANQAITSCGVTHDVMVHSFGISEDGTVPRSSWEKMAKFVNILLKIGADYTTHMLSEYTVHGKPREGQAQMKVIPAEKLYWESFDKRNLLSDISNFRLRRMWKMLGEKRENRARDICDELKEKHPEILEAMLNDLSNVTMRFYMSYFYSERFLSEFPCFVEYFCFPPKPVQGGLITNIDEVPCLIRLKGETRLWGTKAQAAFTKTAMLVQAEIDRYTGELRRRNNINAHLFFRVGSFVTPEKKPGENPEYLMVDRKGYTATFFGSSIVYVDGKSNQTIRMNVPRITYIPCKSLEQQQCDEIDDAYGPEEQDEAPSTVAPVAPLAPEPPAPPPIESVHIKREDTDDANDDDDAKAAFMELEMEEF